MPRILGIFALLLWVGLVHAKDFITQAFYLEDPAGRLSFEQLPQSEFQAFSDVLGKGYSESTFWIRLHIDPEGTKGPLILQILPNYLDKVVLYDPVFGSLGQRATGDEISQRDAYASLNLNLEIPAGTRPRDVWLQIKTNSTFLLVVRALPLNEFLRDDGHQQFRSSFYLALIGLFIVWGTLSWWARRDPVIFAFVLKQSFGLFYLAGILGYLRYGWPPAWTLSSGLVVDLGMGFYGAAAFWFEYRFLREFQPNRYLLGLLKWMPWFLPMYLVLMVSGDTQSAFKLCMALFVFAPILTFLLAWTAQPIANDTGGFRHQFSRKVLVTVYGVILVASLLSTFPVMGWLIRGPMMFDSLVIYSLINGFVILMALQIRIRQDEHLCMALEVQNQVIRREFESEKALRAEQAQFLDMLTHELRTPMTAIAMSLANSECEPEVYADARRSIDEMAAILDRCLVAGQVDGGRLPLQSSNFCVDFEIESAIARCIDPARVIYCKEGDGFMQSDVVLFRMVIANLIDNALKYGEVGTSIVVGLKVKPSEIVVRVENLPGEAGWPDAGCLFQKYLRSPMAQNISGTGLGLYLSRELAQNLGGELLYTPSENRIGFSLCLPL